MATAQTLEAFTALALAERGGRVRNTVCIPPEEGAYPCGGAAGGACRGSVAA